MVESAGTGEKVLRIAAGVIAISAVFWVSYAFDFRQFAVMRMTSEFDRYYEFFLLVWALTGLFYLWDVRLKVPYLLLSAGVLGHVYVWASLQIYFGTISASATISALVTLAAVTTIFLLRREALGRLLTFNAIVAAAVFPLAMQHSIASTDPMQSEATAPRSDH